MISKSSQDDGNSNQRGEKFRFRSSIEKFSTLSYLVEMTALLPEVSASDYRDEHWMAVETAS